MNPVKKISQLKITLAKGAEFRVLGFAFIMGASFLAGIDRFSLGLILCLIMGCIFIFTGFWQKLKAESNDKHEVLLFKIYREDIYALCGMIAFFTILLLVA